MSHDKASSDEPKRVRIPVADNSGRIDYAAYLKGRNSRTENFSLLELDPEKLDRYEHCFMVFITDGEEVEPGRFQTIKNLFRSVVRFITGQEAISILRTLQRQKMTNVNYLDEFTLRFEEHPDMDTTLVFRSAEGEVLDTMIIRLTDEPAEDSIENDEEE